MVYESRAQWGIAAVAKDPRPDMFLGTSSSLWIREYQIQNLKTYDYCDSLPSFSQELLFTYHFHVHVLIRIIKKI